MLLYEQSFESSSRNGSSNREPYNSTAYDNDVDVVHGSAARTEYRLERSPDQIVVNVAFESLAIDAQRLGCGLDGVLDISVRVRIADHERRCEHAATNHLLQEKRSEFLARLAGRVLGRKKNV